MIILLGSTGRIGRLVASLCKMQQRTFAVADRGGDVFLDGRLIGNVWTGLSDLGDSISIADCSIDYSSISRFHRVLSTLTMCTSSPNFILPINMRNFAMTN